MLFLNLQTTSNTHGASPRRGLLCNEYPWDSKEKKGNRLRSPFRLCDAAFIGIKKLNKYVFFGVSFFSSSFAVKQSLCQVSSAAAAVEKLLLLLLLLSFPRVRVWTLEWTARLSGAEHDPRVCTAHGIRSNTNSRHSLCLKDMMRMRSGLHAGPLGGICRPEEEEEE